MNKKSLNLYSIGLLAALGMVLIHFSSTDDTFHRASEWSAVPGSHDIYAGNDGPAYAAEMTAIAGICALLLVAYLFWFFYRKFQSDSRTDLIAMEQSLYTISLETGRTEYDLFCKSAEDWSLSGDRIEQDFKRYPAAGAEFEILITGGYRN